MKVNKHAPVSQVQPGIKTSAQLNHTEILTIPLSTCYLLLLRVHNIQTNLKRVYSSTLRSNPPWLVSVQVPGFLISLNSFPEKCRQERRVVTATTPTGAGANLIGQEPHIELCATPGQIFNALKRHRQWLYRTVTLRPHGCKVDVLVPLVLALGYDYSRRA